MTTIAGSSPSVGPATSTPAPTPPADALGKDAFLKLLVAQLRYQDPMKPSDSSAFLAQTAQFTMVERLDELAGQNAELLASQRALAATTLIGRSVRWAGDGGSAGTVTAVVTGAGGQPRLRVGTTEVALADVTEVVAPAPPPAAPPATTLPETPAATPVAGGD